MLPRLASCCRLAYISSACLAAGASAALDLQALSGLDGLLLGPAAVSCPPQPHADAASHICRAVLQAVRSGGGVILPVSETGEAGGSIVCKSCLHATPQVAATPRITEY